MKYCFSFGSQYLDTSDDLGDCLQNQQNRQKDFSGAGSPSGSTVNRHSSASAGGGRDSSDSGDVVHDVVMKALRAQLLLHGATLSDHLHNAVTHIVVRPQQLARAAKIKVNICITRPISLLLS